MFQIITTVTLICFTVLGILILMYRNYETQVEEPRKLEDELRDGLGVDSEGKPITPDVKALEPVRQSAAAIAFKHDKIVLVRNFNKVKTFGLKALFGIEIFVDGKIFSRIIRSASHKPVDTGAYKSVDEISPTAQSIAFRLIFDDPSHPDFELVLWDPHDNHSARAEGPRAAMETARRWFYHIEALLRQPVLKPLKGPNPELAQLSKPVSAPDLANEWLLSVNPETEQPPKEKKPEGDVLQAPIIPYL